MRFAGFAVLLVLIAGPVLAQNDAADKERERQLEAQKRRELAEIERQAKEKREAAGKLKGQETKAIGDLRKTEKSLNTTRGRLRNLQRQRKKLDGELQATQVDLERAQIALDQQRAKLATRLRNMYKQGAARELEYLLSTSTIPQLLARWDFLVMVAEQDRLLLEDVQRRKEDVQSSKQKLEINLGKVAQNENTTAAERKRLASLQRRRSNQVERIKSEREAYEAAAEELERTARQIKELLAQLERQRRQGLPFVGQFAEGRGQLAWPVQGQLVGRFGNEKHPKWGTTTVNNGVDIQAAMGTPVRAVARARVEYTSEDFGTYGQMIILNHGDGYYTLYGHLSEIGVTQGQEIDSGTVIGRVGDTGSLKGTVLHFEVRQGGTALNPQDWLQ